MAEVPTTNRKELVLDLAMAMAQHHRIDPMTSDDRCTCGYKTPLGRLFTEHIADEMVERLTQHALKILLKGD